MNLPRRGDVMRIRAANAFERRIVGGVAVAKTLGEDTDRKTQPNGALN